MLIRNVNQSVNQSVRELPAMFPGSRSAVLPPAGAWAAEAGLTCALLCRSLVKACRILKKLLIDVNEDTGRNVLNGLNSNFQRRIIYLRVPGKCRRPLSGVTAARLSGPPCAARRLRPLTPCRPPAQAPDAVPPAGSGP